MTHPAPRWQFTLVTPDLTIHLVTSAKYVEALEMFLNMLKTLYSEVALLEDRSRGVDSGLLVMALDGKIVRVAVGKLF